MESYLSVRALQPVVAGMEALGHPVSRWLARAGIPAAALEDPDVRVTQGSMSELWRAALQATGDERLGMRAAIAAPVASFDLVAYAFLSSPNLLGAYERVGRYQRLVHSANETLLEDLGDRTEIRHTLPGGRFAGRQAAEFLVASWLRFGRLAAGEAWEPLLVCFAHDPPDDVEEHERFFGPRILFRAGRNAMQVEARILRRENPRADPGLLEVLDRFATRLLERQPEADTVSGRVRDWLSKSEGATPTADEAARALFMSARTLRRRLASEGTTFRELLNRYRHERATELLADPRHGIGDVAFLLGFADVSAFYRAFQRWTGTTPARYRERLSVRPSPP